MIYAAAFAQLGFDFFKPVRFFGVRAVHLFDFGKPCFKVADFRFKLADFLFKVGIFAVVRGVHTCVFALFENTF